jgi:hypothetical protein
VLLTGAGNKFPLALMVSRFKSPTGQNQYLSL